MKKLSFFNKIAFLINSIFSIGLVCSFFLPALEPQRFGMASVLSLLVPILIIGNLFFVLYWILIGFKKQMIQPFLVLILSYFFFPAPYKFSNQEAGTSKESLTIMTYNVRKFNKYKWIKTENIDTKISEFINGENPDIVVLQEYQATKNFKLNYPYYINPLVNNYSDTARNNKYRTSFAIFSKYPIINDGLLKYNKFKPSTMYADIVRKEDTIRIYNSHLASLGIIPDQDYFGHDDSEKLVNRLSGAFKVQQKQIDVLNEHIGQCKYKKLLIGDFNNTAYSWAYKHSKNELQDSFLAAGKGFGKTYAFKGFPLRIDYIFVDNDISVVGHKNYKQRYSDHYPIAATVEF